LCIAHADKVHGGRIVHKVLCRRDARIGIAGIRHRGDPVQRVVGITSDVAHHVGPLQQIAPGRAAGGVVVKRVAVGRAVGFRITSLARKVKPMGAPPRLAAGGACTVRCDILQMTGSPDPCD